MTPPVVLPSMPAMVEILVIMARPLGRFESGTAPLKMARLPANNPAAPKPATARPNMRTAEEGAVAHRTEPAEKMKSETRYMALVSKQTYMRPKSGWKANCVSK
jgi:hypothetical protein